MTHGKKWQITADKFLSIEQIERLKIRLTDKRDLAIARRQDIQAIRDYYAVRSLMETGLRVFEFCDLVNGDLNGLKLSVRHGKGDKARTVLLTKATSLLLKEWLGVKAKLGHSLDPDSPLFPSRYHTHYTTRGVQKRIKLIFGELSFPAHLSVHSLRHTYCSLLLASGKVSLATVKENLGHSSIAVTNLYAHAVGDISNVELYPSRSSEITELYEPQAIVLSKKPKSSVEAYLRNANFKSEDVA